MTRVKCACGLVLYPQRTHCPECGRPLALAQETSEEVITSTSPYLNDEQKALRERAEEKLKKFKVDLGRFYFNAEHIPDHYELTSRIGAVSVVDVAKVMSWMDRSDQISILFQILEAIGLDATLTKRPGMRGESDEGDDVEGYSELLEIIRDL